MNWFIRKLGGAVLAGIGWKLGSEAYDFAKKRLQEYFDGPVDGKKVEEGAGPQATEVTAAAEERAPEEAA